MMLVYVTVKTSAPLLSTIVSTLGYLNGYGGTVILGSLSPHVFSKQSRMPCSPRSNGEYQHASPSLIPTYNQAIPNSVIHHPAF